jgi:fructose-bisphosphate aldolase class I
MIIEELVATIEAMSIPGKGILAADESTNTIAKRLANIDVESNEANRLAYRHLLFSTKELGEYINGVILFEETLGQKTSDGVPLPQLLNEQGIIPGIKVDKGLITLANTEDEKVTQGLDGLEDRLKSHKELGARFAKWRNVYSIGHYTPSMASVKTGAENLARYAAICQSVGIVPIVEPEILMDGSHNIEQCAEVTEIVLHELFQSLFIHQVALESIILKPSMVISGSTCEDQSGPEEVAEYTLSVFQNTVPAAVPTINFLSGGQTPEQATANLNAMNVLSAQPWNLSFSYGRALQETCLKTWLGKENNIAAAQKELLKRARLNSAASVGEYKKEMENS